MMLKPHSATVDYILRSERNTELALRIIEAGEAIQHAIIERFAMRLKTHLRTCFDNEWELHDDLTPNITAPWGKIYLSKPAWRGLYRIGLCAEQPLGQAIFIGVWCDREHIEERLDQGRIQAELEQPGQTGGWSRDWPYRYLADPLYRNWAQYETLCRINQNEGAAVIRYFEQELSRATSKTGPIIDYIVENWV